MVTRFIDTLDVKITLSKHQGILLNFPIHFDISSTYHFVNQINVIYKGTKVRFIYNKEMN